MPETAESNVNQIVERDTWSFEDYRELIDQLSGGSDATGKLRAILNEMESAEPEPKGAAALKVGLCRYGLCRFAPALHALGAATDNKDRRYVQGLCYKHLGQFDKAIEEFDRAANKGWDAADAGAQTAECLALDGRVEEAGKKLAGIKTSLSDADAAFLQGLLAELTGEPEEAIEQYHQALDAEEDHSAATFRLAYVYDLHGEEEEALELYKECTAGAPVFANALLNLAVLYEDGGAYDAAIGCLRRILNANPQHARARLFLKDAEASKTMYYDEDQARRLAKRNAVLDIPVTDFELSVRARNCLKKMNIRTLGDLVRTTEVDLLAYKNFGETSLKEIKDMLAAKGLRLGQAVEEGPDFGTFEEAFEEPEGDQGVLATPIAEIDFSIRARRALESLGIETLGDLASKTEPELLACKNFGQTSLNEVQQRLAEYGLQLRE